MAKLRIAALGSSYAAGPRIQPVENQAAMRSSRNYAHQLAGKLDADLVDSTVSGATLLNVLNEKQSMGWLSFDPRLDDLPSNASLVTLTAGGNDLQYLSSIIYDSLLSYSGPVKSWFSSKPAAPALNQRQLVDRFLAVLDKIHEIAPRAKVYLVEYLAIIGNSTRPSQDIPLGSEQVQHYDEVAKLLSQAYHDAAEARSWAEVVPMADLSREHALGSAEPWIDGFSLSRLVIGPAPYHPNLAGHTAVAEILHQKVLSDGCVWQDTR